MGFAGPESQAAEHAPALAQAFSALLAAEHGQAIPDQSAPAPAPAAATLSPEAFRKEFGPVFAADVDPVRSLSEIPPPVVPG